MTRQRKVWPVVMGAVLMVFIVTAAAVAINREWLEDWVSGMNYHPVGEIVTIRAELGLTDRGLFLFNAVQPELNERGDFNRNCRGEDSETAVLGCYRGGRVYIYNIVNTELAGVRELTAAHELLHADFARMSEREREQVAGLVQEAYLQNLDVLQGEIELYPEAEQVEEMYVRLGTEVKDLPSELEERLAVIFVDQDRVVDYYDGYVGVFRAIEQRVSELMAELTADRAALDERIASYERRVKQLEADVVSFNACAAVAGCFESSEEFDVRRQRLLDEREALVGVYGEIGELTDAYNEKVAEYNQNVLHGQMLGDAMNSTVVPEVEGDGGASVDDAGGGVGGIVDGGATGGDGGVDVAGGFSGAAGV